MKKIGLISLGCDKNRVDSEILLGNATKNGYSVVSDPMQADVLVVNTCAFIEDARKEAVDAIFDMVNVKNATGAKLVVTGCLVERYKEELFEQLPEVDAIVGAGEYSHFCDILNRLTENNEPRFCCIKPKLDGIEQGDRLLTTPSHFAYVRIADGCDNFCTYCSIPNIRGRFRSRKMEDIYAEVASLVKSGCKEVILIAQDVTNYGIDLYGMRFLSKLIRFLSTIEGLAAIRLLYCYPEHIDDELIEEIASNDKVVKYIDLPLQHVDDDVLKKMNRKSTYAEITALIDKLRSKIKNVALRSTFICGFPGETEQAVTLLNNFLTQYKLTNVGFFAYSKEEGTPAINFENQIPEGEKKKRLKRLATTQNKVALENNKKLIGQTFDVVVDGYADFDEVQNKHIYFGRAFFMAPFVDGLVYVLSTDKLTVGQHVNVCLIDYKNYDLIGEYTNESTK